MPQLIDDSHIERFELPSTENETDKAWVDFKVGKLTPQDLSGVNGETGEAMVSVALLSNRILGWNFTDAEGNLLVISPDTVRLLSLNDYTFLTQKLMAPQGLSDEEKKVSSPISPAEATQIEVSQTTS